LIRGHPVKPFDSAVDTLRASKPRSGQAAALTQPSAHECDAVRSARRFQNSAADWTQIRHRLRVRSCRLSTGNPESRHLVRQRSHRNESSFGCWPDSFLWLLRRTAAPSAASELAST